MSGMKLVVATALPLVLPGLVAAVDPAVEPGEWEFTSTIELDRGPGSREQTLTASQCLKLEEIRDGSAFLGDLDRSTCEVDERTMHVDRMTWRLVCTDKGQGRRVEVEMEVDFRGERLEGESVMEVTTARGASTVTTRMEGRRLGDC